MTKTTPDYYHAFSITSGLRYSDTMTQQQYDQMMTRWEHPNKLLPMCRGCGQNRADHPSGYCPGCQAYKEHQA